MAIVNGRIITQRDLYEAMLDAIGESVLDQLITEELILQAAESAGVSVPDSVIEQKMAQIRAQFSTEADYQEALRQSGLSDRSLRRQLLLNELVTRLLTPQVNVTDEDVKAYFDEHQAELGQPEQVRARHILVKTKEEAEKIRAQLEEGADFAELARKYSLDESSAADGGELGFLTADQLVPEFSEAAFALEVGAISQPVQTQYGYHIIQVEEKKPAVPAKLEEVSRAIVETLTKDRIRQIVPIWLRQLRAKATIQTFWPPAMEPPAAEAPGGQG
ncbi:MAG TPA: foldase [Firmicutes bacterium]|nr:foldase [Bacillota bacterium]